RCWPSPGHRHATARPPRRPRSPRPPARSPARRAARDGSGSGPARRARRRSSPRRPRRAPAPAPDRTAPGRGGGSRAPPAHRSARTRPPAWRSTVASRHTGAAPLCGGGAGWPTTGPLRIVGSADGTTTRSVMRSPKDFFQPLAVGAPPPLREIPVRPARMIHFFPPHLEKVTAKLPELAPKVDVLLGNLEDAIPADSKEAARAGFVKVAKEMDFGETQLWTRVNSLDSPWVLDDLITLVTEVGDKIDVVMIPKVEGPEDIHYVDRLLAQLEARAGLEKPLMVHAILETARGVANVEEICLASPRMQGLSLGPADLAANRRMKTTRVGGG